MSANGDLITVETYLQGKTIENQFLIYGLKCKKYIYFGLFEGPWGYSNFWFCLSCSPAILSSISMYVWNKEAIWIELLVQIQNIKNIFVFIFGGVLVTSNPGLPNVQGSKTSSYSRQVHNKGKSNQEFFIYGSQCEKFKCLDIGGGGGAAGWRLWMGASCFLVILSLKSIYM